MCVRKSQKKHVLAKVVLCKLGLLPLRLKKLARPDVVLVLCYLELLLRSWTAVHVR